MKLKKVKQEDIPMDRVSLDYPRRDIENINRFANLIKADGSRIRLGYVCEAKVYKSKSLEPIYRCFDNDGNEIGTTTNLYSDEIAKIFEKHAWKLEREDAARKIKEIKAKRDREINEIRKGKEQKEKSQQISK